MAALSADDDELLRGLYAEHSGPLLAFAGSLTGGDRQRAEDVVQETLLRAWRHRSALDPARGPVRPWLYAVARNVAVDAIRAARARPQEVADVDGRLAETAGGTDIDEFDRMIDSWVVAEALRALSDEHRAVLTETYFRGRSVAEAAEALGVPPGTVKSRTYYALRALKLALTERGITP